MKPPNSVTSFYYETVGLKTILLWGLIGVAVVAIVAGLVVLVMRSRRNRQ